VAVACLTALISGVSVFVNSYGVHHVKEASVYTTAKNLVATACLAGLGAVALAIRSRRRGGGGVLRRFVSVVPGEPSAPGRSPDAPERQRGVRSSRRLLVWLGFAYVGVVGGGLAFVLYFDGLADMKSEATTAAFLHDTLVIWVAVLAVPFLHERIRWWNIAAVALLVGGQVVLDGGIGHLAADRGDVLVLAATLLWSVEVVLAKRLLHDTAPALLSVVRMGVGTITLVAYLVATGALGALVSLDVDQLKWVAFTGVLLAGYVGTWMTALARARALDVTSVLVGSALITWLLQAAAGTAPTSPAALGLLLIAAGTGLVVWLGASRGSPSLRVRSSV